MKDNIEMLAAIVGVLIGASGALAAVYTRWKASIEKGYAAQRDFQHLKRNQEQMVQNLGEIVQEQDELKQELQAHINEKFNQCNISLTRMEGILHTLLANSQPYPRRHKNDDDQLN